LLADAIDVLEDGRGYRDLDPANCWDEWQQARLALIEREKGKA